MHECLFFALHYVHQPNVQEALGPSYTENRHQHCGVPGKITLIKLIGYLYRPQRSWAKVIFSQACVKNSVHGGGGEGVCLSACWDTPQTRHPPPRDQAHPPEQTHPRDQAHTPEQTPPGTRHTPHPPGPGTPPPQTRHTPPQRPGTPPPPGKQTAAYGQRAAGTHPTGMHSCNKSNELLQK